MEFELLNFDEIGYYCKSSKSNIEFNCLPLLSQLEEIVNIFAYYKITAFIVDDIQNIYNILNLKSPRTGKPIKCSLEMIARNLNKLVESQKICKEFNKYYIVGADIMNYKNNIQSAYTKGNITQWVDYAIVNHDVYNSNVHST